MEVEVWIAFVLASSLILIIPGPTIILVISQAMAHGRKAVVPLAAGVVGGDFTAMTLSLLGLGTVLAASAELFAVFKWAGALYLIYLGIKLWRSGGDQPAVEDADGHGSSRSLFKSSFVVTALNPKSISFFVAFLPQFVDPARLVRGQFLILGASFLVLAALNALLYGVFAGRCYNHLANTAVRRWLGRGGGTALIAAGIFTAGLKRNA